METLEKILAAAEKLGPYWPFFAVAMVLMLVGNVMNRRVFTREAAKAKRSGAWYVLWNSQWFYTWMRRTLPLHPVATAELIALFWKNPSPGVDTLPEQAGYFGLAGVLSVFLYELLKGLGKKVGVDLALPGEDKPSDPPQPPPVPKE